MGHPVRVLQAHIGEDRRVATVRDRAHSRPQPHDSVIADPVSIWPLARSGNFLLGCI